MEERMQFVLRLKDGESMASLCREFGISRVTGYKIYERYKECGLEGLTDLARHFSERRVAPRSGVQKGHSAWSGFLQEWYFPTA
jgi:transposase